MRKISMYTKALFLLIALLVLASCAPVTFTEPTRPVWTATGLPPTITSTTVPTQTSVTTATLPP